jgi:acyl CoA:acetate/3-ketoacid CoA transferase beta subunit
VVNTIITELAVIQVTSDGLVLEEVATGITAADVQRVTAARLLVSPALREITVT